MCLLPGRSMKVDISPSDLHSLLKQGKNVRIVDVRSPREYAVAHIPGAENIPLDTLGKDLPGAVPGQEVVLVCQAGGRSSTACGRIDNPSGTLYNLTGGTSGWISAGYDVEKRAAQQVAPTTECAASRSVERQAHFVGSAILLAALGLGSQVAPGWFFLAALPAFGMMLDALFGWCPMVFILKHAPWNVAR